MIKIIEVHDYGFYLGWLNGSEIVLNKYMDYFATFL